MADDLFGPMTPAELAARLQSQLGVTLQLEEAMHSLEQLVPVLGDDSYDADDHDNDDDDDGGEAADGSLGPEGDKFVQELEAEYAALDSSLSSIEACLDAFEVTKTTLVADVMSLLARAQAARAQAEQEQQADDNGSTTTGQQ